MPAQFKKGERLCSRKIISQLFQKPGGSISNFPFRFSWLSTENDSGFPASVLFTVSKRNFKKAVDRNRIKRQLREAYRLRKHKLYDFLNSKKQSSAFLLAYVGKEPLIYTDLEAKLDTIFEQFMADYERGK